MKHRNTLLSVLLVAALLLAACASATPEIVEKEVVVEKKVIETVIVEKEVVVEKPVIETVVVEKEVVVTVEVPVPAEVGEPLKIGVMSDLSGFLALFGQEIVNGLELGLDYATDGTMTVAGRPIELIIRDDTSDVETGTAAARELIEAEGVEILIGNTSSAVALQVQQIADENEIVYFAAAAASADITGANWNNHTFRVCRNAAQDGLTMAGWSIENVGDEYLILAEDYAFGQATAAGFMAAFGAKGATFLSDEPIYAASDTADFTPFIQQILEADPDGLILIWASNTSGVVLLNQIASQGVLGKIPIISGFSSNDLVALLPAGNIGSIGLIVYHYTLPNTAENDWLIKAHNEKFGENPDLFSECAFATAQAVVAALKATGGDTSSAALIPALEGMKFSGPKGTYFIRPEDHQALASMYIVELVSVDDPDQRFFEKVAEVSGEESAPPCTATPCGG